ncbi:MAG: porin [Sulfitobacter sp.]
MRSTVQICRLALPALIILPGLAAAQDTGPEWDFYGQLNLGVLSADDGFDTETAFTDNDNSNSRVGAIFTSQLGNGSEFRFHFETALGLVGSSSISRDDNSFGEGFRRTDIRKFEVIYDTDTLGKFSFGQGSIATDSTAEADLSGTSVIAYSSLQDQAGSQEFRLGGGGASGTDIGNAFNAFDGGRRFRVRYDTPTVNGFSLAISGGEEVLARGNNDEFYDIGLTYKQDYGDYKVDGRLGYSIRDSAEEFILGSTSVLHAPSGVSVTVASGRAQEADSDYVYAKAGLQRDWLAFGRTFLAVDYYTGDDFAFAGSDSSSVGLVAVQKVDAFNLELFASYRTFELDGAGTTFEDIDVTFVGARWKF